jgi:hypothetical protein
LCRILPLFPNRNNKNDLAALSMTSRPTHLAIRLCSSNLDPVTHSALNPGNGPIRCQHSDQRNIFNLLIAKCTERVFLKREQQIANKTEIIKIKRKLSHQSSTPFFPLVLVCGRQKKTIQLISRTSRFQTSSMKYVAASVLMFLFAVGSINLGDAGYYDR